MVPVGMSRRQRSPVYSFQNELIEVGFPGPDGEFLANEAEPLNKAVDVGDGAGNAAQGILAELRIIEVNRQVLEHQGES